MPTERDIKNVKKYRNKFLCIDKEQMKLNGDWNSETARMIIVRLRICLGASYCRSPEIIKEFIRGKYLVLLHN